MPSSRPPPMLGLRHVALFVQDVERSRAFYMRVFGLVQEWRPDPDTVYLTSGSDNLALHRGPVAPSANLDHLGFVVARPEEVDAWADWIEEQGIPLTAPPRNHRDGARSLYLKDPDGHGIQIIHHPPISSPESGGAG